MAMPAPQVPLITDALVEYLSYLYADKSPDVSMSDREIWLAAGAVQVVRKLRQLHQKQLSEARVITR